MCGRYVTISKIKAVEKRFNAEILNPENWQSNVNISPGTKAPIITNESPNLVQHFQFGFTPHWSNKPMYVFNARLEGDHNKENDPMYSGKAGIYQKPMFKRSIRDKRCLVLADAFIEGPEKEKLSKPYVVYLREHRPFAFAGIWDEWVNAVTGEILSSFAILTTVANPLLQKIGHHRSPVILEPGNECDWISNDTSVCDITSMLKPYTDQAMNAYPIHTSIKNPRAQGLELLRPTGKDILGVGDYLYQGLEYVEGVGGCLDEVNQQQGQQTLF